MRNISRMMACFPLTCQDKCPTSREIFSSGRLPDQTRQDKNVTKCDKWPSVTVHTLLCHQGSNQRDWHLTLLFPSAHRSQNILHPQLQPQKVRQGYERTHFSSMALKSRINTLFIYRIQLTEIIINIKLSTPPPSESHPKWETFTSETTENMKRSVFACMSWSTPATASQPLKKTKSETEWVKNLPNDDL